MRKKMSVAAGYLAIILLTVAGILIGGRTYTFFLPNPYEAETVTVEYTERGIVENTRISFIKGAVALRFRSLKQGSADVTAKVYNEENQQEYTAIHYRFQVLPTGVLFLNGYDYGGFQYTILGMALLSLYTFAICLIRFRRRLKTQFFSYKTMLDLALLAFFGMQGILYTALYAGCVILPQDMEGWKVYNLAGFSMTAFFFASIPLLVIFAGFLSFSNLALIRHEGLRRNNLFGILISLFLFAGSLLCVIAALRNPNSTEMELASVRDAVIRTVVSSAFVYFECILFSAVFCTMYAARREPPYDRDFIIILGCQMDRNGKPYPLLRGRIDRAITFSRKQLEKTGKQARFIPSGGQGADEIISEAACMKNYLTEQGIAEDLILPEDRSTTTLENMRFSKEIADAQKPDAKILFSTTNYHVFRSGMFSAKAGMRAEGVGAKTKWYFWPNAQMREFIGLLASEWKINLLLILAIILVSTLFANISTIIGWIVQ